MNKRNRNSIISLLTRSCAFYLGFLFLISFFGLFTLCSFPFPVKKRKKIAQVMNSLIIRWLCFTCKITVEIIGKENISPAASIYLSNHQSTVETIILQGLLHPATTIAKRELRFIPFFGWGLVIIGTILIDRRRPDRAIRQVLKEGALHLKNGHNIVIFPEGTRQKMADQTKFAGSGAALGISANAPVLPIAHNAATCWPKGFIKFPGTIRVKIGEPLINRNDRKSLTKEAEDWIAENIQAL